MTKTEGSDDNAPCGRAVHTDPESPKTPEQVPLPKEMARKSRNDKSPAEWAYERLILYIRNFEELLDIEHEIALGMTDGGAGVLRIEGIGYFDPDIVTFYGTDSSGARSQLIQHVSQLSVILRAVPKPGTQEEPRRIGFRLVEDLDGT
ncbi:MAG: hypothetical protein HKN02_11655 [Rhodobacteraceae bacterium]|nr:hypothetical protein [Paracoccaceae bacterium]